MRKFYPITLILALLPCFLLAQKIKQQNLPTYDREKLHFGFALGLNKAYFVVDPAENAFDDSLLTLTVKPDWGFNLAIISDLRLHDYATLRLCPALTFQDRRMTYLFDSTALPGINPHPLEERKVESTLLDFPLHLKVRSERLNNVSAYLLGGFKWSLDLASQARTNNPEILKLNNKDFSFEAGFGLDFYLTYFKLSAEIKFAAGMNDRLVHENSPWANPFDALRTKVWFFTLNFEG